MDLDRVRVSWEGPALVGPGVSTFYATAGNGAALSSALKTFFDAIKGYFPSSKVTWSFPNTGEVIDSATGQATGAWSGGTFQTVAASGAGTSWANGVGARVRWNTGVYHNGRRVRGSTFLVPLQSGVYDTDGTLVGSAVTAMQTAAAALVTAVPTMGIHTRPHPGAADGGFATVASAEVPDKVSWLRSRRV